MLQWIEIVVRNFSCNFFSES